MLDARQRKFCDMLADCLDLLASITQLRVQTLQYRMRMPIEQALPNDTVNAAAQFRVAEIITDDLPHQLC